MHEQWLFSNTEQEYYSGKRVNWKMWTGNHGKQWQCMERYTQRPMWKEEDRGLISVEGCIEEEENS